MKAHKIEPSSTSTLSNVKEFLALIEIGLHPEFINLFEIFCLNCESEIAILNPLS